MIKGLKDWAKRNDMPVETSEEDMSIRRVLVPKLIAQQRQNPRPVVRNAPALARQLPNAPRPVVVSPESVPMMFRAQVSDRCSLMYAADDSDRNQWLHEWKHHKQVGTNDAPADYQYKIEEIYEKDPSFHSFTIQFPYRVLTNSGQDSILRPPIGGFGIPYIPGSSIKGLLKRLLQSQYVDELEKKEVEDYCGNSDKPGKVRFHGAFPVGDWSANCLDIVHPQQRRQVEADETTSASALISFYKPQFIIELSSSETALPWQKIEGFIHKALRLGLGGKTSTGYGFIEQPLFTEAPKNVSYPPTRHIQLSGKGVTSTLLNRQYEFRPNCFKASLRGHLRRLIAGVCSCPDRVNQIADGFLGSTGSEGLIQLYWASQDEPQELTYEVEGILHLAARENNLTTELDFTEKVLKFAYVMGGFGKSWRRVWHHDFFPSYYKNTNERKFPIGCHWTSSVPTGVDTPEQLKHFLNSLYQYCQNNFGDTPPAHINNWREAWSPNNVAVFCKVTQDSQAIQLFHDPNFKTTSAIGGRTPHVQHPHTVNPPSSVSSVWHRMLPINESQYLEIVTVFYGGCNQKQWVRKGIDQLPIFIRHLTSKGLQRCWGDDPLQLVANKPIRQPRQ
jgi:CRISPR-associated protein Cmr6